MYSVGGLATTILLSIGQHSNRLFSRLAGGVDCSTRRTSEITYHSAEYLQHQDIFPASRTVAFVQTGLISSPQA